GDEADGIESQGDGGRHADTVFLEGLSEAAELSVGRRIFECGGVARDYSDPPAVAEQFDGFLRQHLAERLVGPAIDSGRKADEWNGQKDPGHDDDQSRDDIFGFAIFHLLRSLPWKFKFPVPLAPI